MKKVIIPAIIALVLLTKTAVAQTVVLRQPARRMMVIKPCPRIIAAPWYYVRPAAFAVAPFVAVHPAVIVSPMPFLHPGRVVMARR